MSQYSAGILLYRFCAHTIQVLLVHPGGPFWVNRDDGAWSLPKGLCDNNEEPLDAAKREFTEETGFGIDGEFVDLGKIKQPSGKIIHAWAVAGDLDPGHISSNTFAMEWPKNSGKIQHFPEIDRGAWFDLETARQKINKGQAQFLDKLLLVVERS